MKPEKYQLLPALPPEQFEALKADIAERGVVVPVLVDEYGTIIDATTGPGPAANLASTTTPSSEIGPDRGRKARLVPQA
jgi:hypothetical protein